MNTNGPSKLARFTLPGMAPVLVPLRPSNEALLRAHVPGHKTNVGVLPTLPITPLYGTVEEAGA
jgi:hypothetical protein